MIGTDITFDRPDTRDSGSCSPGYVVRPRRQCPGLSVALIMVCLWLAPISAHAGGRAAVTAEALMAAHAACVAHPEFDAIGVSAPTVDRHELSKQHGKGSTGPAAKGTSGVAVILWDERGSSGGQTTRVSVTGSGNVQSTTVSVSLR